MSAPARQRRGRVARWSAAITVLLVTVAVTWWAARATLSPSAVAHEGPGLEQIVATVKEGEVGRSIEVGVGITRPTEVLAHNQMAGTVTAVTPAGIRNAGDVLYAVDATAVIAARGDTPFYRALAGGDKGEDVRQLQAMLQELGYLSGQPSGTFGHDTAVAVKKWQRSVGLEDSGSVALGVLVAVPQLPSHLAPGKDLKRSAVLSGGEEAVVGSAAVPTFGAGLAPDQAARISDNAPITVTYAGFTWPAVVSARSVDESGTPQLTFAAPDGGPVCANDCAALPAGTELSARAAVEVVAPARGPSVPLAAVRTATDASTYVVLSDGTRTPVKVLGSSDGTAVLEGVTVGQEVLIERPGASPGPEDTSQ